MHIKKYEIMVKHKEGGKYLWVIVRIIDGVRYYVDRENSSGYTSKLGNAYVFSTREKAREEAILDSEKVVKLVLDEAYGKRS